MRIDLDKLVSQKEAAEIRGCTTQAIAGLIRRGSLKTVTVGGKRLLFKDEVEKFVPSKGGRPKTRQATKKQGVKQKVKR